MGYSIYHLYIGRSGELTQTQIKQSKLKIKELQDIQNITF
jgi:hypothetical protein